MLLSTAQMTFIVSDTIKKGKSKLLTQTTVQVIVLRLHVPLLRETQNRILRPIPRLCSLHPIRTQLDLTRLLSLAKQDILHAAAELRTGIDDEEVVQAALVQGAGGNDTGDAAAENENAGVCVIGFGASGRGEVGRNDEMWECEEDEEDVDKARWCDTRSRRAHFHCQARLKSLETTPVTDLADVLSDFAGRAKNEG